MRIDVSLEMSPVFKRLMDNLSDEKMRPVIAASLNEAALIGQRLIQQDTPVITARLRNSIDVDLADPNFLEARIFTNVIYAPFVEAGSGIYSQNPDSNRSPIVIRAKNERTITYQRKGKTHTRTAVALTFRVGGRWVSTAEVTVLGMAPRAMFRQNIPYIQTALNQALVRNVTEALGG